MALGGQTPAEKLQSKYQQMLSTKTAHINPTVTMKRRGWLLTVALVLAAGGGARAEEGKKPLSVKLLYLGGIGHGFGYELSDPLRQLLRQHHDPPGRSTRVRRDLIYKVGEHYLIEPSSITTRKDLPQGDVQIVERRRVEVLEDRRGILFVHPGSDDYPLLDELQKITAAGSHFLPGVRRKQATLLVYTDSRGRRFTALETAPRRPEDYWHRCGHVESRIDVAGKSLRVTLIAKTMGGYSRVVPAFKRRSEQVSGPVLRLNLGRWTLNSEILGEGRLAPDLYSRVLDEIGVEPLVFAPNELKHFWGQFRTWNAERPPAKKFRFIGTNVELENDAATPILPHWIQEIGGVRIGLLSLWSSRHKALISRGRLPVSWRESAPAAQKVLDDLRNNHKVDVVAAVSFLTNKEERDLLSVVRGIDVLLGREILDEFVSKRRQEVHLTDWNKEHHYEPALIAERPPASFGEIELRFRPARPKAELIAVIEDVPGSIGADRPDEASLHELVDAVLDGFLVPTAPVLPAAQRLWPGRGMYHPIESFNMGAGVLKRALGTEAAFVSTKHRPSNSSGEIPGNIIRLWFDHTGEAVVARLPGHALHALLARVDFQPVPVGDGNIDDPIKYGPGTLLAASGVSRDGRVSGFPIESEEYYSVAFNEDLLYRKDAFPEFKHAVSIRKTGRKTDDVLIDWLTSRRRRRDEEARQGSAASADRRYEDEMRAIFENRPLRRPVWRLNLRELAFRFTNTQVGNGAAFSQVRNDRINSINQTMIESATKLFSEFACHDIRLDAGISTNYGRVTLKPRSSAPIQNETVDQILIETELRYKAVGLGGRFGSYDFGPFANVSYDTEFTRPASRPKRKILRTQPGLKLFGGRRLRQLHVGSMIETDYSTAQTDTLFGWGAGFSWNSPVAKTPLHFVLNFSYREFARNARDTLEDLKRELQTTARLRMPVIGNLRLSPFIDYYVFEGKLNRQTGFNLIFGVSLDYSRLWKPFF